MITVNHVSKQFDTIKAVTDISTSITDRHVYGLIGSNGAGKSTFLRMLCGILKPDSGEILLDEAPIFETVEAKKKVFYISDDLFFFKNATPLTMLAHYKLYYDAFDQRRYLELLEKFGLDKNRKINTFSKGMKKQTAVIAGLCANTKYLLCDETFDGLDPVMRQGVKSLIASDMEERGLTPVIASHNLRELEDICDHIGLLHKGGILFTKDLMDLKLGIHKVQCAFPKESDLKKLFTAMDVIAKEQRGSLYTLTVRGEEEEIMNHIRKENPVLAEILPLTLEEIFISETEVMGYDIRKLIF